MTRLEQVRSKMSVGGFFCQGGAIVTTCASKKTPELLNASQNSTTTNALCVCNLPKCRRISDNTVATPTVTVIKSPLSTAMCGRLDKLTTESRNPFSEFFPPIHR